jgi:hypothetical protein
MAEDSINANLAEGGADAEMKDRPESDSSEHAFDMNDATKTLAADVVDSETNDDLRASPEPHEADSEQAPVVETGEENEVGSDGMNQDTEKSNVNSSPTVTGGAVETSIETVSSSSVSQPETLAPFQEPDESTAVTTNHPGTHQSMNPLSPSCSNQVELEEDNADVKATEIISGQNSALEIEDSSRLSDTADHQPETKDDVEGQTAPVLVKEELLEKPNEIEHANISDEQETARKVTASLDPMEADDVPAHSSADTVESAAAGDAAMNVTTATSAVVKQEEKPDDADVVSDASPALVKQDEKPAPEDATVVRNASPVLVKQEEKEGASAVQDAPVSAVKVEKDTSHTDAPVASQAAPEASVAQYSPRAKEAHERIRRNKCVRMPCLHTHPTRQQRRPAAQ